MTHQCDVSHDSFLNCRNRLDSCMGYWADGVGSIRLREVEGAGSNPARSTRSFESRINV